MLLADYLLSQDGHDWSEYLSGWGDILPSDVTVWMVNRLGDAIFVFPNGTVWILDVGGGHISQLAEDRSDFIQKIDVGDNANLWLAIDLVDACVAAGILLTDRQCYGYKIPPMLGGGYGIENLEPTDLAVHYGILGDIHRQTKDLPDGTRVRMVIK